MKWLFCFETVMSPYSVFFPIISSLSISSCSLFISNTWIPCGYYFFIHNLSQYKNVISPVSRLLLKIGLSRSQGELKISQGVLNRSEVGLKKSQGGLKISQEGLKIKSRIYLKAISKLRANLIRKVSNKHSLRYNLIHQQLEVIQLEDDFLAIVWISFLSMAVSSTTYLCTYLVIISNDLWSVRTISNTKFVKQLTALKIENFQLFSQLLQKALNWDLDPLPPLGYRPAWYRHN